MRRKSMRWTYQARMQSFLKLAVLCLGLTSWFGWADASAASQTATSNGSTLSRTTKAVTYRRSDSALKVAFRATELMPQATGQARVQNKGNRVEIEANFQGVEDATRFGLEYLTYVLWAISPQGRAVNLGEVQVKGGFAQVKAITDMQTFGLVVTAEPYFAVSQPGDEVVLENAADTGGENIEARYELLGRGIYSSSNTKIENAIFGIDHKVPVELFEARNSVRIAKNAGAGSYAVSIIAKADEQLQGAEEAYRQKREKRTVIALSRDTVQTAEEARVISVKKKAEEDAQAQTAAEKKAAEDRAMKAHADAQAEAARRQQAEAARQQAEAARQQAEAAKADAERMKAQAEQAAAEAARAKQDSERARQAALAEQQAAVQQRQAAEAETARAQQAAAKAEAEKAQMRAQLLAQLNSILQTNDTARGLIVNMSDVLFDTASYVLKPGAREKLAKISGILLAHPGLTMQIEGHTDSVGGDEFNQTLSEQRAGSVRDFLAQQGVPVSSVTARGFGKTQPVASNDTPEGRQRNRRVEIVVNGESIGAAAANSARFTNQD